MRASSPPTGRSALVIINPVSGPGRRAVDACSVQAREVLARGGFDVQVRVTTAPGDARQMSAKALGDGVSRVVAWGGDGTLNEVGSALAFSKVPMAIVPGGSGNGLARDLGIPLDARPALELAATGGVRVIDAGQIDQNLFFNVAGVGLDAAIAERLASPHACRGLPGYVQATLAELLRYQACSYVIVTASGRMERRAWFIAVANSPQYGNGAQIAPAARVDDGRLDLVVVEPQPLGRLLRRVPAFFRGSLAPAEGLHMAQVDEATIMSEAAIRYHVDGEPRLGGSAIHVRVRPRALHVISR
ncbi:MAG: diacylglycerol kinase family lipid kinase [Acidobacteria bacterium]|nr:diacylglycerol kinase family lipid kinase [Acidobacteriota bacterium]